MARVIRGLLTALFLGWVIVACTGAVTEVAALEDSGIAVTYPSDWYLADDNLTPNLSDPREVFSLGSFPLAPGGPNCAQIPTRALHDMESTDVFLTVQERRSVDIPSLFDQRPEQFGPISGSTENALYDCVDQEELPDIGAIHWIGFRDEDRYFHVAVAIGRNATTDDASAVWKVLDEVAIEPRA